MVHRSHENVNHAGTTNGDIFRTCRPVSNALSKAESKSNSVFSCKNDTRLDLFLHFLNVRFSKTFPEKFVRRIKKNSINNSLKTRKAAVNKHQIIRACLLLW